MCHWRICQAQGKLQILSTLNVVEALNPTFLSAIAVVADMTATPFKAGNKG
jgi:hypothetical protein